MEVKAAKNSQSFRSALFRGKSVSGNTVIGPNGSAAGLSTFPVEFSAGLGPLACWLC